MARSIDVGDAAPDFSAADQSGQTVKLSALRGRPVVVFFYPKNFTPACTAQACSFRDAYEQFAAAGATVIGVSTASGSNRDSFAARFKLPFHVVADDGAIRAAWGVPKTLWVLPGRVTYVLDGAGVVRLRFASQLNVGKHIDDALATVRSLTGQTPAAGSTV